MIERFSVGFESKDSKNVKRGERREGGGEGKEERGAETKESKEGIAFDILTLAIVYHWITI